MSGAEPAQDGLRPSFAGEWPELARRLERFLGARGVDPWLRADVVQETGLRLFQRWETLDHSSPVWNLAATIAVRLVHNHRRKESRIELVPEPVPVDRDDVHVRGLQRAQLHETRSALQQLTADQRRVLLAEIGEALLPGGTRNRINVLRLRARARLREALGPWAPSAIGIRLRCVRASIAHKRLAAELHLPAMANSLVSVAITATLGLAGAAVSADGIDPVSPEGALSPSSSELRALNVDPLANSQRSERAGLPRTNDGADGSYEDADTGGSSEGLDDWAERRQEEVNDRGREVGNLADDGRDLAEDGREVAEDWARGRQEEAGDRKEEVEDRGEEAGDRKEEVEELLP